MANDFSNRIDHWEALLRDVAAVDHRLGPGDERCLVRGEEQHAISNFDRLTEAAEWSERNLVGRSLALVAFSIGGI